jgi:hypothetical protein
MMKFKILVFTAFIGMISMASCKKGNDAPITTETTLINFLNAGTDTLNFYVNGSRLNTLASLYSLGSTGYINTPLGEQNYQVKKYRNPNVLLSLSLPLEADNIYSLYVTDGTPENTFTSLDDLTPVADTTGVRFVNTSPKAGDMDVFMNDTLRFKTSAFKSASAFLPVSAGIKHIVIYKAGTKDVLSDETRTLQLRRVYTLFTKASLSTGSATSNTGLIINK